MREAQLNCAMDNLAKRVLGSYEQHNYQRNRPSQPICIFAGSTKIMTDMGDYIRFWMHWHMARENFHSLKILFNREFDFVDWEMVHVMLRDVPRLFQLWASK
jgi:hypothetical protein